MSASFEILDVQPPVQVLESEYKRLLGFPADHPWGGRVKELAEQAREWYAAHGRPWIYARATGPFDLGQDTVRVDGCRFASRTLYEHFAQAEAKMGVVTLVSAGKECEERARELWEAEKPDEYFFMEIYGSAVVEHLVTSAGARLCTWAEPQGLAVLPHYSPGYTGWEVADQVSLFGLLAERRAAWPGEFLVRESGMLQPKKSLLALFGLTANREKLPSRGTACESCAFGPCQYRRAPYAGARPLLEDVARLQPGSARSGESRPALTLDASYSVNLKALRKWSRERLEFTPCGDGVEARFRYEGTTCSNMGHPLAFEYVVELGSARVGYPIRKAQCGPAPGDVGHRLMCAYLAAPEKLMAGIAAPPALLGRPLDEVLQWKRVNAPSGCYCQEESRIHKWGLVFEAIHFALAEAEKAKRLQTEVRMPA